MAQTLRGVERGAGDTALEVAEAGVLLIALALAFGAGALGFYIGRETAPEQTKTEAGATTPPATTGAQPNGEGKDVFASAGCGGCHTLGDAGSSGNVGPNLDQAHPSVAVARQTIANGRGAMPAFEGQLTDEQIRAVAQYVSQAAGG
jgi:mono/diheme cytochrome c family protein